MLTVKEVARKMKMNESTIRRLCRIGYIRSKKVGRDWFVVSLKGFVARKRGRQATKEARR